MRAFHPSAVPMWAAVLHNTSFPTRFAAFRPIHWPTRPPTDNPQKERRDPQDDRAIGSHLDRAYQSQIRRRQTWKRMAVTVIPQHAEMFCEWRHLRIPHGKICAQRIRQHEHRQFLIAVQTIVEPARLLWVRMAYLYSRSAISSFQLKETITACPAFQG